MIRFFADRQDCGEPHCLRVLADDTSLRHGVPGRPEPFSALLGPVLGCSTKRPARVGTFRCPRTLGCSLGLGGLDISLGIDHSGSSQFDPLSDSLTVPICLVSCATGSLNRRRKHEAQRWDHGGPQHEGQKISPTMPAARCKDRQAGDDHSNEGAPPATK